MCLILQKYTNKEEEKPAGPNFYEQCMYISILQKGLFLVHLRLRGLAISSD